MARCTLRDNERKFIVAIREAELTGQGQRHDTDTRETAPHLFTPFTLRGVTARNRILISSMCQYSCTDGVATDWHLVHLGSRAVGGAGMVMVEASAVTPEGRISPQDMGIWNSTQRDALARVAAFISAQGAVPAIQLAHAGRKASTHRPWDDGSGEIPPEQGGWQTVAPSALPFADTYPSPRELSTDDIAGLVDAFAAAARRSLEAGFTVVELHGAHGYLMHEFLSPLSNKRADAYGGGFAGRTRFIREVARAVRAVWPERLPLFARLSCTDWVEGGWTLEDSVALARLLREDGVDLIDCSSGGNVPRAQIPVAPGYQVQFAETIKREAGIATAAVGLITAPEQADAIVHDGQADLIALARADLRDPYWPLAAADALGADAPWPVQYERAKPAKP